MVKKNYFTKEYSNAIKGIAVLMLLSHHLFFGQIQTPIHWFGGDSWNQIFATIFKVCVSLFAIISGYGLSQQYKKKEESVNGLDFAVDKTAKLLKQYWFVFLIFVPLGFLLGAKPTDIYGTGMRGVFFFFIDMFGLFPFAGSPTMNYTWWYIEAAIAFYLLFPLFYKIMKKHPMFVLIPTYILFAKWAGAYCREIFWFFPFCTGIYLSQKDSLNRYITRLKNGNEDRRIHIKFSAFCWLFIWLFIRSKIGIAVDVFFAISIIKFVICFVMDRKILKGTFSVLGKHSANIFMTHSFIYYYYSVIATPFNAIQSDIMKYLVLLISSFIVSVLIEVLKSTINKFMEEDIQKESKKKVLPARKEKI